MIYINIYDLRNIYNFNINIYLMIYIYLKKSEKIITNFYF